MYPEGVNLISKPNLFAAARATGNTQLFGKVTRWYELVIRNDFANFIELRTVFPAVDSVGERLVFNLGSYRLICGVSFILRSFYFKALLTHAEYDEGGWKS
jgi:mRNA interferase HigB